MQSAARTEEKLILLDSDSDTGTTDSLKNYRGRLIPSGLINLEQDIWRVGPLS